MLPILKLHKPSEAEWIQEVLDDSETIWLDFEQPKNAPHPTLVGVLYDGHFEQVVFDPLLEQAVEAKIKSDFPIRFDVWEEWLVALESDVESGSSLVGYTEHELKVITKGWQAMGIEEIENENVAYLDANVRKLIGRNAAKLRDDIVRRRTIKRERQPNKLGLKDILCHPNIPFPYPTYLQSFEVGQSIKSFREQQKAKGSYNDWSPGNKRKWTNLLTYNRLDVEGMEFIVDWAWEHWRD